MAYVKFELADGTVVYVESTDTPKGSSGLIPAGRGEHAEQTAISFEKSVDTVRKMAAELVQDLRSGFIEQPSEVSVSFGLKASGEIGGLVVARGGMEANYNVSLRWHREKDEDKDEKKEETKEEKKPAKKGEEAG